MQITSLSSAPNEMKSQEVQGRVCCHCLEMPSVKWATTCICLSIIVADLEIKWIPLLPLQAGDKKCKCDLKDGASGYVKHISHGHRRGSSWSHNIWPMYHPSLYGLLLIIFLLPNSKKMFGFDEWRYNCSLIDVSFHDYGEGEEANSLL